MQGENRGGGVLGSAAASVTDLLAGFLAVFIILFVAAQNQRARGPTIIRNVIASEIKIALESDTGIVVRPHPKDSTALLIVMPDELLFVNKGDDTLTTRGSDRLSIISPKIIAVLCGNPTWRDSVSLTVEGHTDTSPGPTVRFKLDTSSGRLANLLLSQARASTVAGVVVRSVKDSAQRDCLFRIVSASGRGQEEPDEAGTGMPPAKADALNRRVWLNIRVTRAGLGATKKALPGVPTKGGK